MGMDAWSSSRLLGATHGRLSGNSDRRRRDRQAARATHGGRASPSQRHLGVFPRPESMDPQPSPPSAVRRGRAAGRPGTVERKPGSGRTGGGGEPLPADVPGRASHRPGERVGAPPDPLSRICPGPIPGRLPRRVGRERGGRGRPRVDPGAVAPPAAVNPAEPLVGRWERLRRTTYSATCGSTF